MSLFSGKYIKYPRTHHLPFSLGKTNDDNVLSNTDHFKGKMVVITEKMDGENTTLYSDYLHARSLMEDGHPSRNWIKAFHSTIKTKITEDMRICGENLYAIHSIEYEIPSYFLVFSIWDKDECLSWDDTKKKAEEIGLSLVPVLYEGIYNEILVKDIQSKIDLNKSEGYVIRLLDSFKYADFNSSVAKFVRESHVQSETHWMKSKIKPNKLKKI